MFRNSDKSSSCLCNQQCPAVGTLLVLLFSDPMVDVLSEFGNRIHVPPFYVSFILAPLASGKDQACDFASCCSTQSHKEAPSSTNASELIAAFQYSKKQTRAAITISFASLQGAACMNNTFCLVNACACCSMQRFSLQKHVPRGR
eukprot:EG_transcript_31207